MLIMMSLMTLAILILVCLPTYQQIGVASSCLIVIARLIQGFSAGGEFGTSSAMLLN